MITRREFTILAGALIGAPSLLLEACGGGSSGTASATPAPKSTGAATMAAFWWGNADRAKRTEKVIALLEAKFPQYKLTDTWGPNSSYFDKLNTQIASGSPPDIFQMDMKYLSTYIQKGVLLDLGKYGSDTLNLGDFDANLLKEVRTGVGTFALPSALNMFAMVYNTTLIGRAGGSPPAPDATWQQFADWCVTLSKGLPRGTWAVDDFSGAINAFEGWVHSLGMELYTADGKLGYPKQTVLDWFNYWNDLRRAGGVVPADVSAAASNANTQSASTIATGKAAAFMTHSNFLEQYQPLTKDTLAMGPYPKGKRPAIYPKVSQAWCVSARTKFPSQAVQFLDFSINDAGAQKALGVERGAPPVLKARTLVAPLLTPEQSAELDYVAKFSKGTTPRTTLDPSGALDVTTALMQAGQSIGLGGSSVQAATDKFWQAANQALQ